MKKSKLLDALGAFIDLTLAGLLWLVCSLPVITIGTSTAALYYTVVKRVRRDRGHTVQTFLGAFKSNFRDSFVIWLLYLAYIAIGAADKFAYKMMGLGEEGIFASLALLFFIPPVVTFSWMFAYISRFSNTKKNYFLAAVSLTVRHFGRTVLLVLILAGTAALAYLVPITLPIIIGPCALLSSLVIEPVFYTLTKDINTDGMDPWFNE